MHCMLPLCSLSALSAFLLKHAAIIEMCDPHALHAIIVFFISPVSLSALCNDVCGGAVCSAYYQLIQHIVHMAIPVSPLHHVGLHLA